jgi:hypothetical protein
MLGISLIQQAMKTPPITLLNSIGLQNAAQKAALAAHMLKAGTVSSPAVEIIAATAGVIAKPAILAQTAKPARAATAAVLATANTTGFSFGELYLNSPAYPANTAIPAIPAKPASAAIVGVPAVAAVAAIPAIVAPAISAIPGWSDAIEFVKSATGMKIVAYLPYKSAPALIGAGTSSVGAINEITPGALQPMLWLDEKASLVPETVVSEPLTLEQYFYKQALAIIAAPESTSTIENVSKVVAGNVVACKKITLNLSAVNYTLGVDALQLGKLG